MIPVDGLDVIATHLDRCAERVETQAAIARTGRSEAWRGPAAARHGEIVDAHVSDLEALGDDLRAAAVSVRHLGATARRRIVDLGRIDVTAGTRS